MNDIKKLPFQVLFLFLAFFSFADPLPSWNEGPAKSGILKFVQETTEKGGKNCIPIDERIVVFDQDGTLWIEQPVYTEFQFALDRIKATASAHPNWKEEEPFKSVLNNNEEALKNLSKADIIKILATTHSDESVDAFHQEVAQWMEKAVHPKYKRPYTELIYQPMIEVMQLLRAHQFKIYIASGGGQEFIRAYAQKLYGIPPECVIGSTGKMKYVYKNGKPELIKLPEILFIDEKEGKPEAINLIIGRRPVIAFGNSNGDQQMLEWTQAGKRRNFELLVHHDDAEREYAYGPESKIGTFSQALMEEAKKQGWNIASMKNDWKIIFPWQKPLNESKQTVE